MNNNLISRSALIETINEISFYSVHNGEFIEGAGLKDVAYYRERDIYRAIIDAPTVEERPKGKWIAREDMNYLDENKIIHNHFMCDRCGLIHDFIDGHTAQYNFCPNCGADMRGDKNERDA